MSKLSTIPATVGTDRIAGIDVDQLLREIGEASACSSPIDLFRLCLSAQRVLVEAGADDHRKPAETRMDAVSHGSAGRVRAHRGTRLTDADYAAMVKRYGDAGDVANADIIRRQWQVARAGDDIRLATGGCKEGGLHEF